MYWELVINDRHDGDSLLSGSSKLKNKMELEFDDGLKIELENIPLIDFLEKCINSKTTNHRSIGSALLNNTGNTP